MKVKEILSSATNQLKLKDIGTARLDALVLLEDVTGIDRTKLLAEPDREISLNHVEALTKLLNQRAEHQPLAYVRSKTEFYGREFVIKPAVLEPRPESETMIDLLLQLPKLPTQPKIGDIGTGSGALGITAALELPNSQVELLDIDPEALEVAKVNVDKFTPALVVVESNLLEHSSQVNDILLCNLPYVPDDYQINTAATHEPKLAIFGGPDGLDLYRELFEQLQKLPQKPLYLLLESLPPQHPDLTALATPVGYKLTQEDDFIQVFECIQ